MSGWPWQGALVGSLLGGAVGCVLVSRLRLALLRRDVRRQLPARTSLRCWLCSRTILMSEPLTMEPVFSRTEAARVRHGNTADCLRWRPDDLLAARERRGAAR